MEAAKKDLDQNRAPIYEALEQFRHMRVVPFDVPGHKHGRGQPGADRLSGAAVRQCGCQQHEAPGQPLPPHFRHSGS